MSQRIHRRAPRLNRAQRANLTGWLYFIGLLAVLGVVGHLETMPVG